MKDIQKIKEFFSKPLKENTFKKGDKVTYLGYPGEITGINKEMTGAITYNVAYDKGNGRTKVTNLTNKGGEIKLAEAVAEYFKPSIRKDKSNPNFLYVDIAYPEGSGVLSIGGSKTMGGQDREAGAAKALSMGNMIAKKLQTKYNIEDIDVSDLKNGKVEVFAVSDDFIKMASPSLDEAMDVNDPVLMKARAAAFQRSQPKPEPTKPSMSFKNADKIKALKLKRAQLMRDMEQEAEPEGGPIADRYGRELNKIDQAIAKLSGQGDSETNVYMSKDEIDRRAAMMKEGKKETAVDMAKKQLDALGVKYELSGNEFRPFKAIYRPTNKPDRWYDEFEDIIHLFNLGSAVKQSMDESNGFTSGKQMLNIKLRLYPKAVAKINQLIDMIGEDKFTMEMAEWVFDFFNNAHFERPIYEATKDEETEFHKKLDTLVHDTFGKRKGELEEVNLKQSKLSSSEYQKAKKLKDFKASDWKWNADEDLYTKVNEGELTEEADQKQANNYAYQFMQYFDKMRRIVGGNFGDDTRKEFEKLVQSKFSKHTVNETEELTEAYVPSNIKEFAKRKGVSSLVNKVAGWAEKVGKSITGGTAIGYNYSTLILDMTYQGSEIRINTDNDTVTLYDEPVNSFSDFQRVYTYEGDDNLEENVAPNHDGKAAPYGSGYKPLEEKIAKVLDQINEELCPAGKAYIKRRQAAGEKSSAYLSGRGVKVCKGQMSGKAKKKK